MYSNDAMMIKITQVWLEDRNFCANIKRIVSRRAAYINEYGVLRTQVGNWRLSIIRHCL